MGELRIRIPSREQSLRHQRDMLKRLYESYVRSERGPSDSQGLGQKQSASEGQGESEAKGWRCERADVDLDERKTPMYDSYEEVKMKEDTGTLGGEINMSHLWGMALSPTPTQEYTLNPPPLVTADPHKDGRVGVVNVCETSDGVFEEDPASGWEDQGEWSDSAESLV